MKCSGVSDKSREHFIRQQRAASGQSQQLIIDLDQACFAKANKIGVVTTAGQFKEYPIPTPSANPRAITAGPDGNVWFTELDGHKIGRITPAGVITELGVPSQGSPGSIVAGPDGNLWFVEPGAVNAIGRVTPNGGISEYVIPTGPK